MTDQLSSAEPNEGSTAQSGCCVGVDHALSDRDIEVDVETLAAVGNETRYEALRLVAASGRAVPAAASWSRRSA